MSDEVDLARVLCRVEDLAATGAHGFRLGAGDWPLRGFVVARPGGAVRAWINRCAHLGWPLELAEHEFLSADRSHIVCRAHGARYEPDGGRCIAGPCAGASLVPIGVHVHSGCVVLDDDVDVVALSRAAPR